MGTLTDIAARLTPVPVVRRLGRVALRWPAYRWTLRGRTPSGVARPFPDVRGGDRAVGAAVLDGDLPFAGRRLPLGRAPFAGPMPGPRSAASLHGFAWLADLVALGTDAARGRARALVDAWIADAAAIDEPAWRADVLGRRLCAWLAASESLLAGADADFRSRFLASAALQARHLARIGAGVSGTAAAIPAAKGRVAAALGLGVGKLAPALDRLAREVERQVLADGGHVERNPSRQLSVLRDLVDIRAALVEAGEEPPAAVLGAIDRMAPMLRMLRHGDGGLALFNGSSEGERARIDAVLAQAGVKSRPLASAPHAGFERLSAGRTVVILDAGAPPAGPAGAGAHAGPLAVEVGAGRERIIVNCGAFDGDDATWARATRATAAHSTLSVDDADAVEFDAEGRTRRGAAVRAVRREADGATWVEASHDGFRPRFGLTHHRRLWLDAGGGDLRGEDTLAGAPTGAARGYTVRFHLHPEVQASPTEDGRTVLLRTANGTGWRFVSDGGQPAVAESVYLGAGGGPRRCEQIVVSGSVGTNGAQVKWALRREAGKPGKT